MSRWIWIALGLATVLGAALWATLADDGTRAMWSYLGGVALAVGAFEFGVFNIRMADRYLPGMTLAAAMFSYTTTAVALGLVLAASSPRVVDGPAICVGLFVGLAFWVAALISRSWVRPETHEEPVNIALQDEFPTNTP